ncbi:hypothetical protein ACFLQ2_02765 [archaeon]
MDWEGINAIINKLALVVVGVFVAFFISGGLSTSVWLDMEAALMLDAAYIAIAIVLLVALKIAERVLHKPMDAHIKRLSIIVITMLLSTVVFAAIFPSSSSFYDQDPINVIKQELNHVGEGGLGSLSPQVVLFSEAEEYTADVAAHIVGLKPGYVQFCCAGVNDVDGKCEGYYFPQDSFQCTPQELEVTNDTDGKIWAYCPINTTSPCVIGFKPAR